jgi:hypothetical protein
MDLSSLSTQELLIFRNKIIQELENRGVLRTKNLVGDYAEWLVSKEMGLDLKEPNNRGFDATDSQGKRYEIKCRRIYASWQLEVKEDNKERFDYLVALIVDDKFNVKIAFQIPRDVFFEYGQINNRGQCIVRQSSNMFEDSRVKEITRIFQKL